MVLPRSIVTTVANFLDVRKALQIIKMWMPFWHKHSEDWFPTEIPDGFIDTFTTERKFISNSLEVYYNGVLQSPDKQYKENNDKQSYTFLSRRPEGPAGTVMHRYIINLSVPK